MSKIVIVDCPEYSRVEIDTINPVIKATEAQQILKAGTVLEKVDGKYQPLSYTAANGDDAATVGTAAAVLLNTVIVAPNVDAIDGVCVFRHARVFRDALVLPEGIDETSTATVFEELEALGIIATRE